MKVIVTIFDIRVVVSSRITMEALKISFYQANLTFLAFCEPFLLDKKTNTEISSQESVFTRVKTVQLPFESFCENKYDKEKNRKENIKQRNDRTELYFST